MNITVTLEFKTPEEAIQALAKVAGIIATPPVVQLPAPQADKPRRGRPPRKTTTTEGEATRIDQPTPPASPSAPLESQPATQAGAPIQPAPVVPAEVSDSQLKEKVEEL